MKILPTIRYLVVFFLCVAASPPSHATESALPKGNTFVLGIIPEENIFRQTERYAPLVNYLSGKIGLDIKLRILTRYGEGIDDFASGMDGAFLGSLTYILAHARLGVEVVAKPEAPNGLAATHGLLFVRKDSGIRGVAGMKGRRVAFVDPGTAAGFLFPLFYLRNHGIADYKTYFRETYFTGTHEDAIYDVVNGKADIGAAKSTILQRLTRGDERIGRELKFLSRSPDVPETALVVRNGLDPAVKERLWEALLWMHNDPVGRRVLQDFGAAKFVSASDKDYDVLREYARQMKLSLDHYSYQDEQPKTDNRRQQEGRRVTINK